LGLVGAVVFRLLVLSRLKRADAIFPASLPPGLERRARTVGLASAATLLVVAFLTLLARSRAANGAEAMLDPGMIVLTVKATSWGLGWMAQLLAIVLALAGLAVASRDGPQGWGIAAVATVLFAFGQPL